MPLFNSPNGLAMHIYIRLNANLYLKPKMQQFKCLVHSTQVLHNFFVVRHSLSHKFKVNQRSDDIGS